MTSSVSHLALDFNVFECCGINGNFVKYHCPCELKSATTSTPRRSAAKVLMSAAKKVKWPEKNFSSFGGVPEWKWRQASV